MKENYSLLRYWIWYWRIFLLYAVYLFPHQMFYPGYYLLYLCYIGYLVVKSIFY
ncbi:Uncharacterised protein [Salmonella sp. NCTC 11881]|nr:Uncharacterised protein [Salmonella sp. NCTC 11881]